MIERDADGIPLSGKGSKLSDKQMAFVEEYLIDLNGSQAVLRAKYITKNPNRLASELLAHTLVKREIAKRTAEKRIENELTAQYVLMKLQSIVEKTEADNPQAALRGLELLGKHLGLYRDRQEISGPDGKAIEMEQKVREDVNEFTSSIARLVGRGGKGAVSEFPKPSGSGST